MNNESEGMGEVRNVMDNMKILLFVVVVAIFTSYMTTKIITIHYFKVIDGYVKGLMRDMANAVVEATRNK